MKRILAFLSLFFINSLGAQQTDYVDFLEANAIVGLVPDSTKVFGMMSYDFKILKDVDSIFIDAKNMKFAAGVVLNNKGISYKNDSKRLWLYHHFKKDSLYKTMFNYQAYPKQALYFLKRNGDWNIWTQGQGKYTSHWLPSFDDVNEKVTFKIATTFSKGYEILSNGKRLQSNAHLNVNSGVYATSAPMSSYLVALVIGKYNKQTETSKSGIPLEFYYYPKDSLKVEPTYRYSKQIFDFLEGDIGFPYPWLNYKQVPVHDFLYAGMENTSLTIFSDAFVIDSTAFNDKNYVNVNAHELAHQWFGNLVTARSGEHHWLQEGFATYYASLAEREIFGDDYFYFKLYESAQDLGRQDMIGDGTSLLNPKSSSLTFYQRGAWVLQALKVKVGDEVFKQAVKNYLNKYQFSTVETSDFMSEVEVLAEVDLSEFISTWIIQKEFPFEEAIKILEKNSTFIQEYMMIDCEAKTSKCTEYLKYYVSDEAKIKVIAQNPSLVSKETFKNSLKVRQSIAQYVRNISTELKSEYESLLNDKSYLTIEYALYNLWLNFPEQRSKYLNATKDIIGFNDKNVRLLWLVLNLNTIEYQTDKKEEHFNELLNYTSNNYNAEVRLNAFRYLDLMQACNIDCQQNLSLAKKHHNWRLVKFAKDLEAQLNTNLKN